MKNILRSIILAVSISSAYGQVNLKNDLLLYYPFNGNTNDSSGNNVNGTVHGTPSLTTNRFGQAGKAYSFNGSSDYITAAATTLMPTNYTYSLWVSATENSGISSLLSIGGNNVDQNILLSFTDGWIGGGFDGANIYTVGQGTLPTLGTWYHIVVTRDNTNIKLYVNNALVGTTSTSGQTNLYGATSGVFIAKRSAPNDQFFNGSIDDVRIYGRVVTADEIEALFNETAVGISGINSKNETNAFTIFPNPSNGEVEVNYSLPLINYSMIIQNYLGEIVYKENYSTSAAKSKLNLNSIGKGIYYITITSEKGIDTKKIVIQ